VVVEREKNTGGGKEKEKQTTEKGKILTPTRRLANSTRCTEKKRPFRAANDDGTAEGKKDAKGARCGTKPGVSPRIRTQQKRQEIAKEGEEK